MPVNPLPPPVHWSLVDRSRDIAAALAARFAGLADVEVRCGDLLAANAEALVSPANSFGDMDGGVDKAIDAHFGGRAQTLVKNAIAGRYFGELPVGHAIVLATQMPGFRFLVCAPTMRVPGSVRGTIHAYLAMRAALVAVLRHNRKFPDQRIGSVALPGMCTGVGGMPAAEAATQMRAAFDSVVGGKWRSVVHSARAPFALPPQGG